jgi:hypothetical protein
MNSVVRLKPSLPTLGVLVLGVVLAGCGGSHKASGVFTVKKGMTKQRVHKVAGSPYRAGPNCWLYHASKKGTSIDGMRFCFTNGRVSLMQIAQHG